MWKYIRTYLGWGIAAAVCIALEVLMDLVQPSLMSTIVDDGVLGVATGGVSDLGLIARVGLVMVICAVIGCAGGTCNNIFSNICVRSFGNDMRKDVFSCAMELSPSQIESFGAGSLITRSTNDVTQVERLVETFFRTMVRTGLTMIGSIVFMFLLSPTLGLVLLVAFPIAVVLIIIVLKVVAPLFTRLQSLLDGVNAVMQEDLGSVRAIKANVREFYEKARFGQANASLVATQLKALLIFALLNPAMNALMYLIIAAMLVVGHYQVGSGIMTPGVVMSAITYATSLLNAILRLVMLSQDISRGLVSWDRIKAVLQCEPELVSGNAEPPAPAGRIEFKDVSFAFPGSQQLALEGINLTIEPGQTVAIMGTTGCGKTALVDLIPRLHDVTEGSVLLDGMDVREYPLEDLRGRVACALQGVELASESIASNVSWGAPQASSEAIAQALEVAQAAEFVHELPQGQDSPLAERGMNLSGGQRQRLALARAIAKDAPVLILDDATSALDLRTEAAFHRALAAHNPAQTKIMVVQRISSARHADSIVVLQSGRIVAQGTHDELLAGSEVYQGIYCSQFGSMDAEESLREQGGER